MSTLQGQRRPSALVLSGDPAWVGAAQVAADRAGIALTVARSAAGAIRQLAGVHQFGHLLLDPAAAGEYVSSLVEMTCGETDSGVKVVALGERDVGAACERVTIPDPGLLASAVMLPPGQCHTQGDSPRLDPAVLADLVRAGSVRVRFQPVVHIPSRAVLAFEVLARLHNSASGVLPPSAFIPQLEGAGLGRDLLIQVARDAFRSASVLAGAALALNLPLDVLSEPGTLDLLDELRQEAGISAGQILIELTETQLVRDVAKLDRAVERWRAAGYLLAIDDAGPDLPNHRALFRLPFHFVKLDKSVVRRALQSSAARIYLSRTVAVAHRQGLSVIAEGLEDQAAWTLLAELGVDAAQGFMIARPLPPQAVPAWLDGWPG